MILLILLPMRDAFLVAAIILVITLLLKKLKISRWFVNIPSILGILGSLGLLYWSLVFVRGFEAMGIIFLSFFLMIFLIPSLIIANKR